MKKELKHADLIKLYKDGDSTDKSIYNEQRSNLMLVAGNHYTRKDSKFWSRLRDANNVASEQKIRLTKNHVQRICKIYENNILSYSPAVSIEPKNQSELQDQKAAELNNSVWQDVTQRHRFRQKTREFCQDFVRIGECAAKVFWDPYKGQFMGYEAETDEMGQPIVDPLSGQMKEDKSRPRFSGDIVIERVFGFNLFRAKEAKSMGESWFLGIRKMADVDDLKAQFQDDPEKVKKIQASKDDTFIVFDGTNVTQSRESDNQCLLMEVYVRPSINYPNGYFYIYTNEVILYEGELPYGIFPIITEGFDEVPTNARYHSIIKHLRPYQAEINRMASSAAENSIISGQDKIITNFGNKIQNGGLLPGVRNIQVAGGQPIVLPGRTGDQWIAPMEQAIKEMYQIANVQEDLEEKRDQVDVESKLFQTMEQKKKYVIYCTKFMQFLIDVAEVSLSTIRAYIPDEALIPAIGRSEMVNISEFKNTQPLCYQVKLDSSTEDMESKLGKHLMFNHVLQYVGGQLDQKQIGQLIRLAPYANNEQAFEDLTLDYDNATNMVLALDRGEGFAPNTNDDPKYMMKRLANRMRKADFRQLSPEIQAAYGEVYEAFVEINTEQERAIQEAALGYIPMSGMGVTCDMYVPDPNNSSKTMRARVPYDALTWLLKRLEEQGSSQAAILQQSQGVIADMAGKLLRDPAQPPNQGAGEASQPMLGNFG